MTRVETADAVPDGMSTIDEHVMQLVRASRQLRETHLQFAAVLEEFIETSMACLRVLGTSAEERAYQSETPVRLAPEAGLRLRITCFGRFQVHRSGEPLEACRNRNGQTILRYLAAQAGHREHGDVLMDVLWPEDPPTIARHKLHCAISAVRVSLNDGGSAKHAGFLLYEDGAYSLGEASSFSIDADQLLDGYATGQRLRGSAAIAAFEAACRLYVGPFLPDDLYADWSHIRRQQLALAYLDMCGSVAEHMEAIGKPESAAEWALRMLAENPCDERGYRELMRAYARQGRRSEAIRQFRRCERVLDQELGVGPMAETRATFESILRGDLPPLPAAG